jgi:hypothetical protein
MCPIRIFLARRSSPHIIASSVLRHPTFPPASSLLLRIGTRGTSGWIDGASIISDVELASALSLGPALKAHSAVGPDLFNAPKLSLWGLHSAFVEGGGCSHLESIRGENPPLEDEPRPRDFRCGRES